MNDPSPLPPPNQQSPVRPYQLYSHAPDKFEEDEIDLLEYWRVLVHYKVMIVIITLIATVSAGAIAFLMTPIFRSEALLAPVTDEDQNTKSSIVSQLGGIASLAGINLTSSGNNADNILATLTSRKFICDFIKDKKLMPILFADKWNTKTNSWDIKSPDDIPTLLEAYKLFNEDILSVTTDKRTGLVNLAIEWQDPEQAAAWANELVRRINHYEKQQAINEAEKSIAYLKEQLAKTSVVEMQQAIYQLMETQTNKIMLANVRDQYAFKIIDPAIAPEKKIKPKRSLMTVLGFMLGLLVSMVVAGLRSKLG